MTESKFSVNFKNMLGRLHNYEQELQAHNDSQRAANPEDPELVNIQKELNSVKPQWFHNVEKFLQTIDVQAEYELIKKKKSKLSRSKRDAVVIIATVK